MMKQILGASAAILSVAACATPIPPVEVTRFHAPNPPVSGTVAVEEMPGNPDVSLEFGSYAAAVGQELQRAGFSEVQGKASDYQALVSFRRTFRPTGDGRPYKPVTVGGSVGGAVGSGGGWGRHRGGGFSTGGIGLGIGIDLSGPPKDIIITEMMVQIRRRADGTAIWEGRAMTQAKQGTPAAQPGLAAAKLASALFGGYPGRSGETITVR